MLHKPPGGESAAQRTMALVLSVSLTTFLIGGALGYGALRMSASPSAPTAGGPAAATGKPKPTAQPQLVRTGLVEQKKFVPVRSLVGDLIPIRSTSIATEVAGKIVEIPVDEGTQVIAGKTLLARIDSTWTRLEADKIAAQIAEKKATLAYQRSDLQRYTKLLERNAVSVSEATLKESTIEELEASLRQLEVMLEESQERKSRLEIYAPFDGSVVSKQAEVGEYLPQGTEIVEIVSTGRIYARVMVPEELLPLLDIGAPIDLIADSLGTEFQGKITSINAQGSVGSRTFPVRIELDDQGGKLLPGMGCTVFVPVTRESTELLVPRDAVLIKPDESTVWVLQPKQDSSAGGTPTLIAQPVPVRVLSHTRDAYAIACVRDIDRELLAPGIQVVTEGLERLIPGAVVRVDADSTQLAPVPGTYRTGQQVVDRPLETPAE